MDSADDGQPTRLDTGQLASCHRRQHTELDALHRLAGNGCEATRLEATGACAGHRGQPGDVHAVHVLPTHGCDSTERDPFQ